METLIRALLIFAGTVAGVAMFLQPLMWLVILAIATAGLFFLQIYARRLVATAPIAARRWFELRPLYLVPVGAVLTALSLLIATAPVVESVYGRILDAKVVLEAGKIVGGGLGALLSAAAIYLFGKDEGRFSPGPKLRAALQEEFHDRFRTGTPENDAVWVDHAVEGVAGETGWDMAGRKRRSEIIQIALQRGG